MNRIVFICILLLTLLNGFSSCSKDDDKQAKISLVNMTKSGCQNYITESRASSVIVSDSVECKALGDDRLLVMHKNVLFGCDKEVITSIESVNDLVYVNEKQDVSMVNCLCLHDFTYTISGFQVGKKYTLIINEMNTEKGRISFMYNSSLIIKEKI